MPRSALTYKLKAAADHHLYTLVSSLGRLWARPLTSLMTIGVLATALALPTALLVGLRGLAVLSDSWESLGEAALFLQSDADEAQAKELGARLGSHVDIAEVSLLSPQSAFEDFRRHSEFGEVLGTLRENPLPWVIVLRLHSQVANNKDFDALAAEFGQLPKVDFVQFDSAWLQRFNALLSVGRRSIQGIGILLALAVLLIVGNTIRLDIQNRREEIEVAKMLGATNGFVRRPFLYSGCWYGAWGGILAWLVVVAGFALLSSPLLSLAASYGASFELRGITVIDGVRLIAIGAIIGWLGSWLAVARELSKIQPT